VKLAAGTFIITEDQMGIDGRVLQHFDVYYVRDDKK
jgi:hypothetical protein